MALTLVSPVVVELKDARVFAVEGRTGALYHVITHPIGDTCNCPATGECWHRREVRQQIAAEASA